MRKLVVSMNITLDGCLSGPRGELDWHFNSWTEEMCSALCNELAKADTILLGRKTYAAMAALWPSKLADPCCRGEDFAFANMMNTYRKIVFSNTLKSTAWSNTILATGNLQDQVDLLKKTPGKNMMVYGSAQLVDSLIVSGRVDEYQLWLHPVIVGKGRPLFKSGIFPSAPLSQLQLVQVQKFENGVIRLDYQTSHDKK
jgi:dihydrofolate reductase